MLLSKIFYQNSQDGVSINQVLNSLICESDLYASAVNKAYYTYTILYCKAGNLVAKSADCVVSPTKA